MCEHVHFVFMPTRVFMPTSTQCMSKGCSAHQVVRGALVLFWGLMQGVLKNNARSHYYLICSGFGAFGMNVPAAQITEHIFIGGQFASCNIPQLLAQDVSVIINCNFPACPSAYRTHFQYIDLRCGLTFLYQIHVQLGPGSSILVAPLGGGGGGHVTAHVTAQQNGADIIQ